MIISKKILRIFSPILFNNIVSKNILFGRHLHDQTHKNLSEKYLFITNTLISGVLMGLGDVLQQSIVSYKRFPGESHYNKERTKNMVIVGCTLGPTQHVFYKTLDHFLPKNNLATVAKKVVLDLAIASPLVILIFFYVLGLLEGQHAEDMHAEVKEKFLPIFITDCIAWPPIQYVNFAYLSNKHRVVYVNAIMVVYNVFLSYIKYEYKPSGNKSK